MIESYLHRALCSYVDNVDCFAVPSRFYLEKFVEWGFDRNKFEYVPNFVDAGRYEPRYDPGDRFVYVGRLSREKGVHTLIEAAAAAGVSLDIVGSGPAEGALREAAVRAGGGRADVRFLGYLSGTALQRAVAAARAVVVPSEWYENAPLAVLEACALGKPDIASAIGGLPELVDDETGWTFAAGSTDALAERLSRAAGLADGALRRLGMAARQRVQRHFSPERYLDSIRTIYGRIGVAW
jgi:glycosyltransferase involved in cell wall biosynthesis